jgi:hypothetical protein
MLVHVSYKKQIIFFILVALIILSLFEIVLRVNDYFFYNLFFSCPALNSDAMQNIDNKLKEKICSDWFDISIKHVPLSKLEPNQHLPTIDINSYGLRGSEIKLEKPENTYRIIILGGSTIFGIGTTNENTIPAKLQQEFDKSNSKLNVEVINAGIPGIKSMGESHYVKNEFLQFNPDLIIVYDGVNDAQHAIQPYFLEHHDPFWNKFLKPLNNQDLPFFRSNSFIYENFLYPVITSNDDDIIHKTTETWKTQWIDTCESVTTDGTDMIIILQPRLGTGNKSLTDGESTMLSNLLLDSSENIPLMILDQMSRELPNLTTCTNTFDFRNTMDDVSISIYMDYAHMNNSGNEIVAQKIFSVINDTIK